MPIPPVDTEYSSLTIKKKEKNIIYLHALQPDDSQYAPSTQHNATEPCATRSPSPPRPLSQSPGKSCRNAFFPFDDWAWCSIRLDQHRAARHQMTRSTKNSKPRNLFVPFRHHLPTNLLIPPFRSSHSYDVRIQRKLITRQRVTRAVSVRMPKTIRILLTL